MIQETSLEAYHMVMESGYLGRKQEEVYKALYEHPYSTDKELSYYTGIPINVVVPRRNELMKMDVLEECGKRECKVTKYNAHVWKISDSPDVEKMKKKKTEKTMCITCMGQGYI